MSKRILSAKDAAAITPSAASSIEVAALQRTVAWWVDTCRVMDDSTNRLLALLERIAAEQATAKPTRLKKAVTADG